MVSLNCLEQFRDTSSKIHGEKDALTEYQAE